VIARVALIMLLAAGPALAQDPGADFGTLLGQADGLARTGQIEASEAAYEQAIAAATSDEERAQALWLLANGRRGRGDDAGAIEALARVLELEGGGAWLAPCMAQLATLASRHGRPDLARAASERMVEALGPTSAQAAPAMLALARADSDAGDLDAAIARLETMLAAAEHSPVHVQARELLVDCLLLHAQRERALATARAAADDSHRARLLMRIAIMADDAGDLDAADAVARELLAEMPDHPQAIELVHAIAVERGTVAELLADLRARAAGDDPEPALRMLARIATLEHDAPAALDAWERLLALHPEDPDAHRAVGGLALDAGDVERAETAFRRALELAPESQPAAESLAEVLVRRGRTDQAVTTLRRAVSYEPADLTTVRSLGYLLARYSLNHEAVAAYREGRAATGDEDALAWEMARAQIALLDYPAATRELLAALEQEDVSTRMVAYELERLVSDEIAGPEVLAVIAEQPTADLSDAQRVALGRAWLAAGDMGRALELLGETEFAAQEVAEIARESELRGEPALAAGLYVFALERGLPAPEAARAAMSLAKLEADRGHWQEALEALDIALIDDDPQALLLRVELLLEHAHRPEEAGLALLQLEALAGDDPAWAGPVRWGRAQWLFAMGRLDEAEEAFTDLLVSGDAPAPGGFEAPPPLPPGFEQPVFPPEMLAPPGMVPPPVYVFTGGEETLAALRLAEIALRRGDLEVAQQRLRTLAARWPDSDEANDALEWLSFVRENLDGEGRAEGDYLRALMLLDRGAFDEAQMLLQEVAGTRGEPLADDALMLLARARHDAGDAARAVETWLRVADRFGDGLLAPQALLHAARVLRDELDDPAGAADALGRILEDHADSAAAEQARDELELLRGVSS